VLASEALSVGLVSRVLESKARAVEDAVAMAETIAKKSPVAVLGTKEVLNFSRDHSVEDGGFFSPLLLFLLVPVFPFSSLKLLDGRWGGKKRGEEK